MNDSRDIPSDSRLEAGRIGDVPLKPRPARITMGMVWEELFAFASLERGAIYTLVQMARRPGDFIRSYLAGDRKRATNPIRFVAMSTALITLLYLTVMPRDAFVAEFEQSIDSEVELQRLSEADIETTAQASELLAQLESSTESRFLRSKVRNAKSTLNESMPQRLGSITLSWMNVFLLAALPLNTLLTFLAFRRAKYNLAEHVVINAFIVAFQNFLGILLFIPIGIGGAAVASIIYLFLSFAYQFLVFRSVFNYRGILGTLFALFIVLIAALAYVTLQGMATFLLLWLSTR
ncbi:MAG: DUF3667 domain-containing protein [Planctomycetota bacterium]